MYESVLDVIESVREFAARSRDATATICDAEADCLVLVPRHKGPNRARRAASVFWLVYTYSRRLSVPYRAPSAVRNAAL